MSAAQYKKCTLVLVCSLLSCCFAPLLFAVTLLYYFRPFLFHGFRAYAGESCKFIGFFKQMFGNACVLLSWMIWFEVLAAIVGVAAAPVWEKEGCEIEFSEVPTFYEETDKQCNSDMYDKFLELASLGESCGSASLRDYRLAVIDTRPKTSNLAATTLYANLYHQKV